jgi:hypothetical protein
MIKCPYSIENGSYLITVIAITALSLRQQAIQEFRDCLRIAARSSMFSTMPLI